MTRGGGGSKIGGRPVTYFLNRPFLEHPGTTRVVCRDRESRYVEDRGLAWTLFLITWL